MGTGADKTARASVVSQMETIVSEYETALLGYAGRIVNSPTLAQDVVQNVFIKLYNGWKDGMKPSPKLKGWLYRVAHNEAVDFVRKESRLKVLHEKHAEKVLDECPDGHNCPAAVADRKELVLVNLKKLHPVEQQIVILRMENGFSYKEISEVTGRSEGNIGNILHHAVKKLTVMMKKHRETGGVQ